MRKALIVLIALSVLLTGCNTSVGFSLLGDLVKLRIDREAEGKGHIEDVFVEETEDEQ